MVLKLTLSARGRYILMSDNQRPSYLIFFGSYSNTINNYSFDVIEIKIQL